MVSRYSLTNQHFKLGVTQSGRRSFPFIPGLAFIVLGLLVLFAPRLLIAAIATVLFMIGGLLCFAAWKFVQFKRQLTNLARDLDGRIQVQAFHVKEPKTPSSDGDDKKIIYH
jgi:hypothetical protein